MQLADAVAHEGLRPDLPEGIGQDLEFLLWQCGLHLPEERPPISRIVRKLRQARLAEQQRVWAAAGRR